MSYQYPSKYQCVKCGHEYNWTPSWPHPFQMTTEAGYKVMPCPKCINQFLLDNFPAPKLIQAVVDRSEF